MTREEAIKILNTVLFFGKCDCSKEEIEECLKMAIKALEQEPILDKIRNEVERKIVKRPWLDFKDRERDRNDAF